MTAAYAFCAGVFGSIYVSTYDEKGSVIVLIAAIMSALGAVLHLDLHK